MQRPLIALIAALAAACSPPAEPPAASTPAAEAPSAVDLGPYTNSWNASAFSRFDHTVRAASPGEHQLTLSARTNSPGGETVAVYPIGDDGQPSTARIMFVVATTSGESRTETVTIPDSGLAVAVIVENASGRPFAGDYTLSVAP